MVYFMKNRGRLALFSTSTHGDWSERAAVSVAISSVRALDGQYQIAAGRM
jgi:hypothetical protein